MKKHYKNYCIDNYGKRYLEIYAPLKEATLEKLKTVDLPEKKVDELNAIAQKKAIKDTTINAIKEYPEIEPTNIWKAIYEAHIHRRSGIDDSSIIENVISADQSWKKSSGHAFEEIVSDLGNNALETNGIEIILQKDMNLLLKNNNISNEDKDKIWLREQINASIFDLYAIINIGNEKKCFGCIQSKTSIRDRVTRDREPSINAMKSFFWSSVLVFDGDFLKNEKFMNMVNGGSSEFEENGWHGMYVFSNQYIKDRIYPTDLNMKNFKEHAIEASKYWLKQRQWFNNKWKAKTESVN